jgi:hypothetical protein
MVMYKKVFVVFLFTLAICFNPVVSMASQTKEAVQIERISPEQARERVQSGEAILVCSYEDSKCKDILLEEAMLRSAFESKLGSLQKDQEIIFYCG